ncbi:MAG: ATP-binding cassette domain-containing protein, partial [bacterium]
QLGLIYAPHTSAGRLPTELGLRFFVDALMQVGDLNEAERQSIQSQLSSVGEAQSVEAALDQLELRPHAKKLAQRLSGGMKRRIDLAKGLMHRPSFVILDEPTTGLDPGARIDLWAYLEEARSRDGLSVLITTHLMEDADRCDRLLFLDKGKSVALDTPDALRSDVGGDIVTIQAADLDGLASELANRFSQASEIVDGALRIRRHNGPEFVPELFEAFPGRIQAVRVGKPTLEDVFIQRTGHRLWDTDAA